jgi:hypothetical protein
MTGAKYSIDGANKRMELSQDFPIRETGADYRNASGIKNEKYPCLPWKKTCCISLEWRYIP